MKLSQWHCLQLAIEKLMRELGTSIKKLTIFNNLTTIPCYLWADSQRGWNLSWISLIDNEDDLSNCLSINLLLGEILLVLVLLASS